YIPFSTSDLYNWKHQNPPFSEKPQALISLLESVFHTHDPTWDDCQQLFQALFTSEEKERIRGQAIKSVLGGSEGPLNEQQWARIEVQLPSTHPPWQANSSGGREALQNYRQHLLANLRGAARKPTNLSKAREGSEAQPVPAPEGSSLAAIPGSYGQEVMVTAHSVSVRGGIQASHASVQGVKTVLVETGPPVSPNPEQTSSASAPMGRLEPGGRKGAAPPLVESIALARDAELTQALMVDTQPSGSICFSELLSEARCLLPTGDRPSAGVPARSDRSLARVMVDLLVGRSLVTREGAAVEAEVALQNKVVALYFAAGRCAPSRDFTPLLCDFYTALVGEARRPAPFEVVFVSVDGSAQEMLDFMLELHGAWLALPFHDPYRQSSLSTPSIYRACWAWVPGHPPWGSGICIPKEPLLQGLGTLLWVWEQAKVPESELKKKYSITATPKLLIVKQSGEVITSKGRKQIREQGLACFQNWVEVADIFQNFSG
ncbi:Nucleoredoxin-like protein 2, partial [Heterocephalus glaber]